VHFPERVQLASAVATLAAAKPMAAPERATRAADAKLVVHADDARSSDGVSPDALVEVARKDRNEAAQQHLDSAPDESREGSTKRRSAARRRKRGRERRSTR
jgi:hypothetical protein